MIVSRFAPAPTGFLHLGHVVNALHVWGLTRAGGGRVLLRIEDHDRQRSRPHFERAILDDLDWLGFVPDAPPTDAFRAGRCRGRQRDREEVYAAALAALCGHDARCGPRATGSSVSGSRDGGSGEAGAIASGTRRDGSGGTGSIAAGSRSGGLQPNGLPLAYACDCTRSELRTATAHAGGTFAPDAELRYSGRCAARGLAWGPGLGLRVRLADTVERFVDLRHGLQEQRPSGQCGDLLVKDREGNWTYQFAVTVDDLDQGVTLVIRGDDLLASTGRQILLARMLGREEPPQFLHHGLIMKSDTQKLSKADRDTSVRDMREAGLSADAVVGHAMHAAGFIRQRVSLGADAAGRMLADQYASALEHLGRR